MWKMVLLQISKSQNTMKRNLSKFDRLDVYIHLSSILGLSPILSPIVFKT